MFTLGVIVYDRVCTLKLFVKTEELFESNLPLVSIWHNKNKAAEFFFLNFFLCHLRRKSYSHGNILCNNKISFKYERCLGESLVPKTWVIFLTNIWKFLQCLKNRVHGGCSTFWGWKILGQMNVGCSPFYLETSIQVTYEF